MPPVRVGSLVFRLMSIRHCRLFVSLCFERGVLATLESSLWQTFLFRVLSLVFLRHDFDCFFELGQLDLRPLAI